MFVCNYPKLTDVDGSLEIEASASFDFTSFVPLVSIASAALSSLGLGGACWSVGAIGFWRPMGENLGEYQGVPRCHGQ